MSVVPTAATSGQIDGPGVRERYPDQVEVVFHDVKRDPRVARTYGIRLIPTQVFLLPDGKEFFRHEGFLPLADVEEVLARMGVGR